MDNKDVLNGINDITKGLDSILAFCKDSVDNAVKNVSDETAIQVAEILNKTNIHSSIKDVEENIEKLKNMSKNAN
jgi:hypothetical protein